MLLPPVFGSVGRVLNGVEVRLVDEEGGEALVGDAGEIWVKGPNVFAGYLDDPEATERVLTPDGWLRTGDIAVCDDDGRLYLVDRAKDLIIVSGFNVFPAEVEDCLARHEAVEEVAAIGVDDADYGTRLRAFVVLADGHEAGEDELKDHVKRNLARYKVPREIVFLDELPRNATGKVLKRQLAERDADGSDGDGSDPA